MNGRGEGRVRVGGVSEGWRWCTKVKMVEAMGPGDREVKGNERKGSEGGGVSGVRVEVRMGMEGRSERQGGE